MTSSSPAQRLLCRRTKWCLPVSESLLHQSVPPVTVARGKHLVRGAKVKSYYDKTVSKGRGPLVPGKFVNSKHNDHHCGERWNFGEVLSEVIPRSYLTKTQDRLVRRTITHLRLVSFAAVFRNDKQRFCERNCCSPESFPSVFQTTN